MSVKIHKVVHTGISRLLLNEISIPQLLLYSVGVFIGLLMILLTFQAYRDFTYRGENENNHQATEFVVLSEMVNGLSLTNHNTINLDSIKAQEWVVKAAEFTPADFSVTASLDLMGRSMSTALFFESIPEDFLDDVPATFKFDPTAEEAVIPIILPRDYLALYNFGFASTRGLPRIGEDTMKRLPFTVSISGNGKQQNFDARIVGFSNRANTIAVPMEFMTWANSKFGKRDSKKPSRIIAEISVAPSSNEFKQFLEKNKLVLGGDKENSIDFESILLHLVTTVIAVGIVICVLSVALLILNLSLLLHKSREAIYRLKVIGYNPMFITLKYTALTALLNLVLLFAVILCVYFANNWFGDVVVSSGFGYKCSITPTVLLGVAMMTLVSLYGFFVFKFKIYRI